MKIVARPKLWWEAFAGFMPTTLRLIAGRRSPGSITGYLGGKSAYADDILGVVGLQPGQGADAVIVSDAGPLGWAWQGLVQPEIRKVAEQTLRGWSGEDPVALWERLKASPPPAELGAEIATHLWMQARSLGNVPVRRNETDGHWEIPTQIGVWKPAVQRGIWSNGPSSGLRFPETVAERIQSFGESIATYLALQSANARARQVHVKNGRWVVAGYAHLSHIAREKGFTERLLPATLAEALAGLEAVPWPFLAVLHGDVALAVPQGDLDGVYVYLDPPYLGATPYAVDCSRERVLALARDLHARGAVVIISEAESLVELLGPEWHAVNLSGRRSWQSRTARKEKGEWLTVNRPPARIPARQMGLAL